jgi:uncharacterized membrane protein
MTVDAGSTGLRALERRPAGARSRLAAIVRERSWAIVVWVAITTWSAALFAIVRSDYVNFRNGRFDLGNMVQAVWSTAQGRPLEITMGDSGDQAVRLASHVDPILVLLAPLWVVAPTPLTLAFVQIAAAALGALPAFWLGRRHVTSERTAALLALAYLAYPWLAWTALDAFHPVTLAIPLFLFGLWFLDTERPWAFAVCAVLIASTGELMGLSIAAVGLWFWLARGKRSAGLLIAGLGIAWTAVAVALVIPGFRGETSPYYDYFDHVGGSPAGLVKTVFTDPAAIVSALTEWGDVVYLVLLSGPLAGAFFLAPGMAALALPALLVNGLSDLPAQNDPRHHYIAAVLPFLVAASVFGVARLGPSRRPIAALSILAFCLVFSADLGRWPVVAGGRPRVFHPDLPAEHVAALRAGLALVPSDARVSASNVAGSHLSARRYIYNVPLIAEADWVVVDERDPWMNPYPRFRAALERDPDWVALFREDQVSVFRRAAPR